MFIRKSMDALARVAPDAASNPQKRPVIVVLENVRSMQNVGSVFRTCDAFAVEALYLCGYTPAPPHRDIQKTALGATETVTWRHFADTGEAVAALKAAGYRIAAAEQAHQSTALHAFRFPDAGGLAIVFGNEVSGVSDEILQIADYCLEIPQSGAKHSLNVSVAAGVLLWELCRAGI